MAKYAVIFGRDSWEDGHPVLLYGHVECTTDSLEKAGAARKVLQQAEVRRLKMRLVFILTLICVAASCQTFIHNVGSIGENATEEAREDLAVATEDCAELAQSSANTAAILGVIGVAGLTMTGAITLLFVNIATGSIQLAMVPAIAIAQGLVWHQEQTHAEQFRREARDIRRKKQNTGNCFGPGSPKVVELHE